MPNCPIFRFGKYPRREGFTLVEILTVLAVIALMAGILAPALTGLGKAESLSASASLVANYANMARENAMAKNAMVALVVLTDPNQKNDDRAMILMELDTKSDGSAPAATDWKQSTKWQALSPGVIFDPASLNFNKSSDSAAADGVPSPQLPALSYNGSQVNSYSYLIFLPNGSLLRSNASQLKLADGLISSSGAVMYTRPVVGGGAPSDYYNITVLSATGRIKIDRP